VTLGVRLVVLGKQGSGKGTQCERLSHHYVVPHISTGEMFRAASRAGTELGQRVKGYMDAGELVPDDLVIEVVDVQLDEDNTRSRGFVFDGFPRNTHQAERLVDLLEPFGIDLAIDLEVPTEVALKRLATRRVCSDCGTNYSVDHPPRIDWICDVCGGEVVQRGDDTEEAISRRLNIYERETAPLIAWYRERHELVTVDGLGSPDDVMDRLLDAVDGHRRVKPSRQ
jgi:adenylate kinase